MELLEGAFHIMVIWVTRSFEGDTIFLPDIIIF